MRFALAAVLAGCLTLSSGCSSSRTCTQDDEFTIDFYSGGGFTGVVTGSTITCNGTVKHWTGNPTASHLYTDSLDLGSADLKAIRKLMQSDELYSYTKKEVGDYTTYIVLAGKGKANSISYIGNDLPADAPKSLTELVGVLKKIQR